MAEGCGSCESKEIVADRLVIARFERFLLISVKKIWFLRNFIIFVV